ncbi:hypothetical protein [Tissierella sp.]|uniref:hypothetical protein n=1 Tax=Tissierella sp. TaxID=41274 RepID=UPI0028ADE43D|nr:hypothetical protein [Tissierella sp.]
MKIYPRKKKKNTKNKGNIAYDFSAPKGSIATQFIVCPMGIGDIPQQADLAKIP